jgi:hypothetical protein
MFFCNGSKIDENVLSMSFCNPLKRHWASGQPALMRARILATNSEPKSLQRPTADLLK